MIKPVERLIFALDVSARQEAFDLVKILQGHVGWFKIGLELFVAQGPELVKDIVSSGERVFLDLKLHDIPATVKGALKSAASLGAGLITVHVQAGAAWREAIKAAENLKVVGVSVLTSLSPQDLAALGSSVIDPAALAAQRAVLAKEAGLAGLVCSGREAAQVRRVLGVEGLIICPGIRPAWSLVAGDDQARATTPAGALKAGADMIVVGRPIKNAPDPAAAADKVTAELAGARP